MHPFTKPPNAFRNRFQETPTKRGALVRQYKGSYKKRVNLDSFYQNTSQLEKIGKFSDSLEVLLSTALYVFSFIIFEYFFPINQTFYQCKSKAILFLSRIISKENNITREIPILIFYLLLSSRIQEFIGKFSGASILSIALTIMISSRLYFSLVDNEYDYLSVLAILSILSSSLHLIIKPIGSSRWIYNLVKSLLLSTIISIIKFEISFIFVFPLICIIASIIASHSNMSGALVGLALSAVFLALSFAAIIVFDASTNKVGITLDTPLFADLLSHTARPVLLSAALVTAVGVLSALISRRFAVMALEIAAVVTALLGLRAPLSSQHDLRARVLAVASVAALGSCAAACSFKGPVLALAAVLCLAAGDALFAVVKWSVIYLFFISYYH